MGKVLNSDECFKSYLYMMTLCVENKKTDCSFQDNPFLVNLCGWITSFHPFLRPFREAFPQVLHFLLSFLQ